MFRVSKGPERLPADWRAAAGEFVWREAGTRHVAWTPEGGLMLAMFQVPNKFFEQDGRVTDISGADWNSIWGHVFED
jgi:hypothetical protein